MTDEHRFYVARDYEHVEEDGKIIRKHELIGSVLAVRSRKSGEKTKYNIRGIVDCKEITQPVFNLQYYVVKEMKA